MEEEKSIDRYLKMAEEAYDRLDGEHEFEYASKALELDDNCAQAWLRKMLSIAHLASCPTGTRVGEAIDYGKKAVALDPTLANEVYSFFLQYAKELLRLMTLLMNNYRSFRETVECEKDVLRLCKAIPTEQIEDNQELSERSVDVAKSWVVYENAMERAWRELEQPGYFTEEKRMRYTQFLLEILRGVPIEQVDTSGIVISNQGSIPTRGQETRNVNKGCFWFSVLFIIMMYMAIKCNG